MSNEARILLYEVLLGWVSPEQIQKELPDGGSRHPFIGMRDLITGQASRKSQVWTVEVKLSEAD